MKVKLMFVAMAVCSLMFAGVPAWAQSDVPKFEVGAQYSLLNFNPFITTRRWKSGGGGRFTFNFNKYVAAEAQIDYFPNEDTQRIRTFVIPLWGSKTLTVFGVKAGTRRGRFGVFAKARPGFIHFSHVPGLVCGATDEPCPELGKTHFAFDFGGVVEYYPSRRLVVRFDAGDTIIRHKVFFRTSNQFQSSIGVGLRF